MVKRYWSSNDIIFSNFRPCSLDHDSFIGDPSVSLLLPSIDQIVSELGTSTFLSEVTKPLSIRYPSLIFRGPNKVTLCSLSRVTL